MPKGFTLPRSPRGLAAITPSPPWHFAGEILGVEYWADPAAAASFLPDGLVPDPQCNGHAFILFADMQFTAHGCEHQDPARYQFRQALLVIDAQWQGRPVMFCPMLFSNNDASLARGWLQGLPERLGAISMTRSFTAPGPAACRLEPGTKFAASLSSHGARLASASVTLQSKIEVSEDIAQRPLALLRYVPQLAKARRAEPTPNDLALFRPERVAVVDIWVGDAELTFSVAPNEEFDALAPVSVGSGFRVGVSYAISDSEAPKGDVG